MRLGKLSEKYESNGDPGAYANTNGDKGGPSYGLYQLAIKTGALQEYLEFTKYKAYFNGIAPGSMKFNRRWKELARRDSVGFAEDQHEYHVKVYFKPIRQYADSLNLPNTNAINQVLWSTATQHGLGKTKQFLRSLQSKTEKDIIKGIYDARAQQFKNSKYYNSSTSRKRVMGNVLKRYENELVDALKLIED